jgi:phospholipid-binding lipoprotein MlaA
MVWAMDENNLRGRDSLGMKGFFQTFLLLLLILLSLFLLPCTAVADPESESVDFLNDSFYEEDLAIIDINDPLEPLNRAFFDFNDMAYTHVLDPIASVYSTVVASDFRMIIGNFFSNLEEPVRFVNALLQGRLEDSSQILARFFLNSIFGVAGLGDPATTDFGLLPVRATLGETLGVWGVGDGFYLVVPLYGPTTLRDLTGSLVDGLALTPYYSWADGYEEQIAIYFGKETNKLSFRLGQYEDLKRLSFDPYVAMRNGYLQHRVRGRDEPLEDQD